MEAAGSDRADGPWMLGFHTFLGKLCDRWGPNSRPADPLFAATDGQLTLPGSPDWSPGINPGCQPDGQLSSFKRRKFESRMEKMLKPVPGSWNRENKTHLQLLVERRRRQHQVTL